MNKSCARCQKVVYPIEELKCLDKIWHKTCFKCTECGMALNMRTYKGFNKNPYCEAHIPKAKATAIADTPELKRIAENTKIQSNVKYHEDFEKAKGKFTQVADDPETLRIKQNTKIISNVAYHGDLEKKAAMERQRETAELTENQEESEYFSETLAAEQFSQYAPTANAAVTTTPPEQLSPPLPPLQQQQQIQSKHMQQQHQSQHHYQPHMHITDGAQQQQQQLHHMMQYQQQQQTLPPAPIHHQQHNTATIIPSSQAAQANAQSYNSQQNHMQHQYQHYQQPQALRQQQQPQQQQQQSPIKQASHLYPSGNVSVQQQTNLTRQQMQYNQQQQQQQQQQPNVNNSNNSNSNNPSANNYNQLRTAILQNSHHPTGTNMPATVRDMNKTSPNTPYAPYDPYDNNYARPAAAVTSQPATAIYNHSNGSGVANNNNITYQMHAQTTPQQQQQQQMHKMQQQQQQQQQQRYVISANSPQQLYAGNNVNSGGYNNYSSISRTNNSPQGMSHSNGINVAAAIGGNGSGSGNNYNNTITPTTSTTNNLISNNIGKIADYDPLTDGPRQMPNTARQSTTLIYSSDSRGGSANNAYAMQGRIGSISDIDPVNGIYGSLTGENNGAPNNYHHQQQHQQHQQQQHQQQQQQQKVNQQYQQMQKSQTAGPPVSKLIYRALYDYEAQDLDEVSFREGDVIFEVESIDSGWMTGRVERTGKVGMLPANYVERAVI